MGAPSARTQAPGRRHRCSRAIISGGTAPSLDASPGDVAPGRFGLGQGRFYPGFRATRASESQAYRIAPAGRRTDPGHRLAEALARIQVAARAGRLWLQVT